MKINTKKNIKNLSKDFNISIKKSSKILNRLDAGGEKNSPSNLGEDFKLEWKIVNALTQLIMTGKWDEEE